MPSSCTFADGPIAFVSVFKSGTHAMRYMLEQLTGLGVHEPPVERGKANYADPDQLQFVPGHFYSWHLVPTPEVCRRLQHAQAQPVFLLRNPFDLAVSMYHHFADNIDADIGRGRNVAHYFAELSEAAGIMAIIEGIERRDFHWRGLGPHLDQMSRMLAFAAEYPCFVTTYARVTGSTKRAELGRLSAYLKLDLADTRLDEIVEASRFDRMRCRAVKAGRGSHFRVGVAGGHQSVLDDAHRAAVQRQLLEHAPELVDFARAAALDELAASSADNRPY